MKANVTEKSEKTTTDGTDKAEVIDKASGGDGRMYVKWEALLPDPEQPRKEFNRKKLEELAASIKEQGIVQDILVRRVKGEPYFAGIAPKDDKENLYTVAPEACRGANGDDHSRDIKVKGRAEAEALAQRLSKDHYVIVDGERRWRAAELAGLKVVPVAVRTVDERKKLALQVTVNQQHENLTALEEAAAYAREIESGRHTAESLHQALGISRAKLFSRLALNRLHPPVRTALLAGSISVSVAGLVAMVPEKTRQEELLEEIAETEWDKAMSFDDVKEIVEARYCKSLVKAPFDAKLVYVGNFKAEAAGGKFALEKVELESVGACERCAFRTGNMAEVNARSPNVCTRPACWEAKAEAAWRERSTRARVEGQATLDGKAWVKARHQYVVPELEEWIGGKHRSWKDAMGGQAKGLKTVLVRENGRVFEAVSRADARAAAERNGIKFEKASPRDHDDWEAERKKKQEKAKAMAQAAARALPVMVAKLRALPSAEAWRLMAREVCFDSEFIKQHKIVPKGGRGAADALDKWIAALSAAEAQAAALEAQYCSGAVDSWSASWSPRFETAAKLCGVDLAKLVKEVQAEKAPKPAKVKKGKKK